MTAAKRFSPPPGDVRVWVPLLLCLILTAGMLLRCGELNRRSIWFDEAFSWRLTQFSFVEMVQRSASDVHPPLYYICLKTWAALFGNSPFTIRSLSLVFSALTIVGMYLFTAHAFAGREDLGTGNGRKARGLGLFVACLVAVSIFQARYGSEARMYALGTALAAFSSWALLVALQASSRRIGKWAFYALLSLLYVYTHNYALFSLAAHALFVIGWLCVQADWDAIAIVRMPAFRHGLLAATVVALGYLPWVPVLLLQRAQVQADYWISPMTEWTLPELFYKMFVVVDAPGTISHRRALLASDLCALALLALYRKARMGEWYLFSAAIVPVGLSVLASAFGTNVFHLRFFLFAHLFLLVGLAVLVARLPYRTLRYLAGAAIVWALLYANNSYWRRVDLEHRPGARGAAEYIFSQCTAEEPVVVCSPFFYLPLRYYSRGQSNLYCYTDGQPFLHYHGGPVMTPGDILTIDGLKMVKAKSVWVINMAGGVWGDRTVPVPEGWVAEEQRTFPEAVWMGDLIVVRYATGAGKGR